MIQKIIREENTRQPLKTTDFKDPVGLVVAQVLTCEVTYLASKKPGVGKFVVAHRIISV